MRVMVRRVSPIRVHGAEVLDLELNQALRQILGVTMLGRKLVRFVLKLTRHDAHEQFNNRVERGEDIRKQDESDDDGLLSVETERLVQGAVVDEDGKDSEEPESMSLGSGEQLGGVTLAPVSQLVAENGDDLGDVALFN